MKLLTDQELHACIVGIQDPIVSSCPATADYYGKDSPIQPASIDLHVGKIFIPGDQAGTDGKPLPYTETILAVGQTAIICTNEELKLPANLTGIAFPPSRVSARGILMTNPGLIDPGYSGPLHLTVMNMSKEPFAFKKGEAILSIILFELAVPPKSDWKVRYKSESPSELTYPALSKLSADFASVELRAEKIAAAAVSRAEVAVKRLQLWTAFYGVLITAIASIIVCCVSTTFGPQGRIDLLDAKVGNISKNVDDNSRLTGLQISLEDQINDLKLKLKAVEDAQALSNKQKPH